MSNVRWSIIVAEETDRALRSYLAGKGTKKGDLSRFVDEAVQARLFELTVKDVKDRNQAVSQAEILEEGAYERTRTIDYETGMETYERFSDTGSIRHLHTGLTVRRVNRESFRIHPDDPHSAEGTCTWTMQHARGDWSAEVEASVTVKAVRGRWRISAKLSARDRDGVVSEQTWTEDVPRDFV